MPDLKPDLRPPSQPSLERRRVISLDEQELRRLNSAYIAACTAADDDPTPENVKRAEGAARAIDVHIRETKGRSIARDVGRVLRTVLKGMER